MTLRNAELYQTRAIELSSYIIPSKCVSCHIIVIITPCNTTFVIPYLAPFVVREKGACWTNYKMIIHPYSNIEVTPPPSQKPSDLQIQLKGFVDTSSANLQIFQRSTRTKGVEETNFEWQICLGGLGLKQRANFRMHFF